MRSDRLDTLRARRSSWSVRLARTGSAAALALMVATCHSDNATNVCAVTTLAFTVQPSGATAVSPITVTVTARDGAGATRTCFNEAVTMALGANPSGATLGGTLTATASGGVATFSNLQITKSGTGYTLVATGGGTSSASASFTVNPGPPNVLAFTTQPATATAGAAISATVTARDQYGNTATSFVGSVTIAIGANPGSGTLGGTKDVTASAGVATFSGLSIDKVGTGYTLTATPTAGAPPAAVTSTTFNINPGAPVKLAFIAQPTNASAGSPINPAVQVAAQDAQGNTTPAYVSNVTIAIGTNPGAGTLSGSAVATPVNGVATFAGLSINKPGTGYTLSATGAGLTAGTSAGFNVAIGPASQLVFTTQPSSAVAGVAIAPAVVVTAQDAGGNTVTGFVGNVTVAIGTNPGSGTLSGNLTNAAVAGVATFNSLKIDKAAAGYTLTATSGGVPQIASATFAITPAAAAKLAFTGQPANTAAGLAIAPPVQVTALDQFDNVATSFNGNVTVAIGTNANSGTLSGTASLAAASGVATFSTLSIDSAGTGYTLTATAAGVTDGTSSTFNIVPGVATHLVFSVQPSNAIAGAAIAPAVKVTALDAKGNVATAYVANVAVAIGVNPGAGTLSGSASLPAVAGVATFTGLNINKSGLGYTLTTSSGTLTGTTSTTFNIIAGAANHLVFAVPPVNTAAGAAVAPAIQVAAQDALGNTDLTYVSNVTLGFGVNAGSGILTGGGPVAAVAGVATFPTTSIDKVGTGYTLTAASGALTGATSATFNIFANTATHLIFFVQPVNAVAGVAIAPTVVVQALDGSNNVATGFTGGISVDIDNNAGGGTLSGNPAVTAVAGVASFSTLSINKTGDGYTLAATAGGVAGAVSTGFNITPAAATHLVFSQQPASAVAGAAIAPAVTVSALDAFDNVDTAYAAQVDASIGSNPGGGTLTGTTPKAATNGVATFSDLNINKTGVGYTLHATSGTLTDATSSTFDISPAALSQMVFTGQPTSAIAGATIQPNVLVAGQDAFGNTVTSFAGNVSVVIGTNPASGQLLGTTSVPAAGGVATFSNLNIDKAGSGYTLTASATGAADGTSTSFDITAGAATVLAFTIQPGSTTAGGAISPPIVVAAQDGLGNTVPTFTDNITIAIGTNGGTPTPGQLTGTASVAATAGVATFSNLSIDKAGTGYTLAATSGVLGGATSNTFNINAGAATKLTFTTGPATTIAGAPITPDVVVTAQDPQGNTDPTFTGSVAVAITGGTGKTGALLSGTLSHAAGAGVATFPGLNIDSAGTGYSLTATSGLLTAGTSATFDINAGTVTQLLFTVQPTSAQAGATITPNVTLVAKDAIGNINTTYAIPVGLSLQANPSGATLFNFSVTASGGVATFPGLFLDKVGTGYTLQASDGSVTSATSNTFNITPGAATTLAFIQQPSQVTVGANIFPAVKVAAQDNFGNTVTSFANNITMSLPTNPGGATLGGTLTKAAVSGVATFSTLDVSVAANGYQLGAAAAPLTSATSVLFNVIPNTATQLFFDVQPSTTVAGNVMATFTVEARDASGQVDVNYTGNVTITLSPANGFAAGTLTRTASFGTATFDNIEIDVAASNYKLTATGTGGVASATSGFFSITPAAADHLTYLVQPSNATALSSITPQVELAVRDQFDNTVTGYVGNVTMSINTAPGTGVLSGTLQKAVASGVATFNNLSIDQAGLGYQLDATAAPALAGSSVQTSDAFDITVSTSNHLVFTAQPATTTAGATISTVTLEARDAANSLLSGFNGPVTVAITGGTGTTGATLSGTLTKSAVNGVVQFTDLSINKKGTGYRLSVTASTLAGATSNPFSINAGTPAKVSFIDDPTSTSAGATITPAITVDLEDALGNRVTGVAASVSLSFSVNAGGGTLSGTATQAVNTGTGLATFNDMSIDAAGSGYRLLASSTGLTSDVSQAFTISAGTADHLVFTVSPSNAVAGVAINPQVRVTAFDALGNVATGFGNTVTVTLTPGTGTPGAVLSGGAPQTAIPVNGVASFGGLFVNLVGTGYTLSATASGVTGTTSGTFDISPAAADHLVFSVQPSNTAANASITPAVVVTAVDFFGNTATSYAGTITVAMGTNAGGAGTVLSGVKVLGATAGVASFGNLSINNVGNGYTLTAVGSTPSLPLIGSSAFNIF